MQLATTTRLDRWVLAGLVVAAIAGAASSGGGSAQRELATAVMTNGFAIMDGAPSDRHVVAIDWDGQQVYRRAVAVIAPEARMVGTSAGIAVGWLDKQKLQLAHVTGDGQLGDRSAWGKKATQLCEGTASNEHMFAIGWLESDNSAWVVFGPTRRAAVHVPVPEALTTARTTWCGVASAGQKIGLLTRDDKGRMFLNLCDRKGCSGFPTRVPINPKLALAGMTCTGDACLIATRDEQGAAQLGWITLAGKLVWTKPLADATRDTTFSLVPAGDNAFAVGYVTREGATATRVIKSGSMVRTWADPHSAEPPVLAWANDRLLVAHRHGDNVAPEVIALPR